MKKSHSDYFRALQNYTVHAEDLRRRREAEPYDPKKMDCSKMPLGCWLWIAVAAVGLWLFAQKFLLA